MTATAKSDDDRIKHLYAAAIFGGTSLAGASMLLDLLRSHKRKQDAETGKDNDTVTLYMPNSKDPKLKAAAAGIHDIVGASLAAGGTYYALKQLYKHWRKNQLKKEIEDEALHYVNEVNKLNEKKAIADAGSIFTKLPQSILLLSALVGGAGTYGILENTFPKVEPKNRAGRPKKIVVKGFGTVHADDKPGGVFAQMDKKRQQKALEAEIDEAEKEEPKLSKDPTVELDEDIEIPLTENDLRKAAAFTALILTDRHCEASPLGDLFGRIVLDKSASQVAELVRETDVMGAISACKGLHHIFRDASPTLKRAAIASAFDNPTLRAPLGVLTLAEFHELHPTMTKLAKDLYEHPSCGPIAFKLASMFYDLEVRENVPHEKLAASVAGSPMEASWLRDWGNMEPKAAPKDEYQMDEEPDEPDDERDPIDLFMAGETPKR
jgi:hypothetical protein